MRLGESTDCPPDNERVPSTFCTVWSLTIALVVGPVRHARPAEMVRDAVESDDKPGNAI
jgi:hypothetical protein